MTTEPAAGSAEPVERPGGLHLLLVESEDVPAQLYTFRFKLEGFAVTRAREGAEAVSAAGETHPDAVLLDLCLPDMGGLEALERIRSRLHNRSVPVITLAPEGQEDLGRRSIEAGATECFPRGVGPGELSRAIREWVSRPRKTRGSASNHVQAPARA